MRTILATALALAALTSAALADGAVELTETQLDQITAGVSLDKIRARALDDDVIDTLLGLSRRHDIRGTDARNGVLPNLRTGNPAVSTALIPFSN